MDSALLSSIIKPVEAALGLVVMAILLCILWKVVTFVWAELSGWNTLAKLYPDRPEIPAVSIKQRVMFVAKNSYKLNYIFDVESTQGGIRFRSRQTLVKTFASVFIPWSDLEGPQNNSPLGYLTPEIIFSTTKLPEMRLKFTRYTADWLTGEKSRYHK